MNTFDVYKSYLALSRHFTSDYDYFKYRGQVKVSSEALNKRNDKRFFSKIVHLRDPINFLIGNFLYNPSSWVGDFNEDYRNRYEYVKGNGFRLFQENCLPSLLPNFSGNFIVDNTHSIPYTLRLFSDGKITLNDVCALELILECDKKWKAKPQYLIFGQKSKFIVKAAPFFDIDIDKYKTAMLQYFQ